MSIAENPTRQPIPAKRTFVDRKRASRRYESAGIERRQFPDTSLENSTEASELGRLIDRYKFENGLKRIGYEQLLQVIKAAGYSR